MEVKEQNRTHKSRWVLRCRSKQTKEKKEKRGWSVIMHRLMRCNRGHTYRWSRPAVSSVTLLYDGSGAKLHFGRDPLERERNKRDTLDRRRKTKEQITALTLNTNLQRQISSWCPPSQEMWERCVKIMYCSKWHVNCYVGLKEKTPLKTRIGYREKGATTKS